MTDEEARFDAWVRTAAATYRDTPGPVPREAMWTAIRAELDRPAHPSRVVRLRPGFRLAAAAAMLLVTWYGGVRMGIRRAAPVAAATADTASVVYAEAARRHFERADVLLTSTRGALAADSLDPALTGWARDLLAETRLLLDSPAAGPARRRALLEDLELTLAQIVQLSAAGTDDDRTLVDRALRRGDLLTRLRRAVPLGTHGT